MGLPNVEQRCRHYWNYKGSKVHGAANSYTYWVLCEQCERINSIWTTEKEADARVIALKAAQYTANIAKQGLGRRMRKARARSRRLSRAS